MFTENVSRVQDLILNSCKAKKQPSINASHICIQDYNVKLYSANSNSYI